MEGFEGFEGFENIGARATAFRCVDAEISTAHAACLKALGVAVPAVPAPRLERYTSGDPEAIEAAMLGATTDILAALKSLNDAARRLDFVQNLFRPYADANERRERE